MKDAALACLSPTWRFYLPMFSLPEMWRTPMCEEGDVTSVSLGRLVGAASPAASDRDVHISLSFLSLRSI